MKKITLLLLPLIFILGCEENTAPTCEITAPENNAEIEKGTTVTISADAVDADDNLQEVRFYIDNAGVSSSSSFPYTYSWSTSDVSTGLHTIKATAIDEEGEESSDNISVIITTGGSSGNEPEANFTASSTSISVGVSVNFTDQSTNTPTSWSWSFDGGTPTSSTSQNPTVSYNSTGTYTVELTVTNNQGSDTETKTDYITVTSGGGSTFTDPRDGNVYQTVIIGNQEWMAENLKYLPSVVGPGTGSQTIPYYYVYDYNGTDVSAAKATANYDTYGVLYNWPAAMDGSSSSSSNPSAVQGICPDGWHLPSDDEWKELEMALGMSQTEADDTGYRGTNEGSKLAENAGLWPDGELDQNPEFGSSGFTALPGGYRGSPGYFLSIGNTGTWWSAFAYYTNDAWRRHLYFNNSNVHRSNYYKESGLSVRCLRD